MARDPNSGLKSEMVSKINAVTLRFSSRSCNGASTRYSACEPALVSHRGRLSGGASAERLKLGEFQRSAWPNVSPLVPLSKTLRRSTHRFVLRPVVCLRAEMRRCGLRSCFRGLASARTEQSAMGSVGPGIVSFTSSDISDRRWRAYIIWRTARPLSVMSQPPLARLMSFCEKMSRLGTRSPGLLVRSNPDRWSPD